MRQKVELIGGYFDGMHTLVGVGDQSVVLIAPLNQEVKFDDSLYPEPTKTELNTYQRRLGHATKFDWVKP